MGVSFGMGAKRRLKVSYGLRKVNLGDNLFAMDSGGGGDGDGNDFLCLTNDVGSTTLTVAMQFTRMVVSDIADPVATHIIVGIKYSMISLFTSHQVDMGCNFLYDDKIYTTVIINNSTVACNFDDDDGPITYLPM